MVERILNTCTLRISSAGQADLEIAVSGLIAPVRIAELIRRLQDQIDR